LTKGGGESGYGVTLLPIQLFPLIAAEGVHGANNAIRILEDHDVPRTSDDVAPGFRDS
jgi:hypothetical protein